MTAPPLGDDAFNQLALSLFHLQFTHNAFYRRHCQAQHITPENLAHWTAIPAVPTIAFKHYEVTALSPDDRAKVFYSSGTTDQERSRNLHNHNSLQTYESSLTHWFKTVFAGALPPALKLISLTPSSHYCPHSSLVHMLETIGNNLASPTTFLGTTDPSGNWLLAPQSIHTLLQDLSASPAPIGLLGTAFNFVHLLDYLSEQKQKMHLPPGSWIMETGGYKGRSRTLAKIELHRMLSEHLGVPPTHIVSEYGMCELSSQAYDHLCGTPETNRTFRFPPWVRVQIISPETGREVPLGETGLIRVFDLANVYSAMAIQTQDLGVRRTHGFELLGRAAAAEPRGCSLMSTAG